MAGRDSDLNRAPPPRARAARLIDFVTHEEPPPPWWCVTAAANFPPAALAAALDNVHVLLLGPTSSTVVTLGLV